MRFTNTNLVNINDDILKDSAKLQDSIRKADLDLLDKINQLSDQLTTLSNSLGITNTGIQTKFYAFYQAPTGQVLVAGTPAIVNFSTKLIDDNFTVTTGSNWKYTATTNGYYLISYNIYVTAGAVNNFFITQIYVNGSLLIDKNYQNQTTTAGIVMNGSCILKLNANDYVQIYGYSLSINITIQQESRIEIIKL